MNDKQKLEAIKAAIQGEWDNEQLLKIGDLHANTNLNILEILEITEDEEAEPAPLIIKSEGSSGEETGATYILPDGRKVYIGVYDLDFFRKLQQLPAETKIEMMLLTKDDMIKSITTANVKLRQRLNEILKHQWYWRETGEKFDWPAGVIPGIGLLKTQMIKKLKSATNNVSPEDIQKIIYWFDRPDTDVYIKE